MPLRIAKLKVLTMIWRQSLRYCCGGELRAPWKASWQHFSCEHVQQLVLPREMPTWVHKGTTEGCSPPCYLSHCVAGGKPLLDGQKVADACYGDNVRDNEF